MSSGGGYAGRQNFIPPKFYTCIIKNESRPLAIIKNENRLLYRNNKKWKLIWVSNKKWNCHLYLSGLVLTAYQVGRSCVAYCKSIFKNILCRTVLPKTAPTSSEEIKGARINLNWTFFVEQKQIPHGRASFKRKLGWFLVHFCWSERAFRLEKRDRHANFRRLQRAICFRNCITTV